MNPYAFDVGRAMGQLRPDRIYLGAMTYRRPRQGVDTMGLVIVVITTGLFLSGRSAECRVLTSTPSVQAEVTDLRNRTGRPHLLLYWRGFFQYTCRPDVHDTWMA